MAKATLLDIARHLKLSKSTVSVALRGKPGVSEEMRLRIMAAAERLGYRPDPVAAELMAMVRSRRHAIGAETIAFINTFQRPQLMNQEYGFRAFIQGARERAESFGYKLEVFEAFGSGMRPERLCQVLKARGIRGVLVGPRYFNEPDIPFDWDAFSCVLVGEARYGASLYRVCNHHVHSTSTALLRLAALGYRRIGAMFEETYETVRGFDFQVGVEEARLSLGRKAKIFPLRVKGWDEAAYVHWIQAHRLDAVLCMYYQGEMAIRMRSESGRPIAFACIALPKGAVPDMPHADASTWAGIEQFPGQIGEASMEVLRNLLQAGERGVKPQARTLLIEGKWVDGPTAPPIA